MECIIIYQSLRNWSIINSIRKVLRIIIKSFKYISRELLNVLNNICNGRNFPAH